MSTAGTHGRLEAAQLVALVELGADLEPVGDGQAAQQNAGGDDDGFGHWNPTPGVVGSGKGAGAAPLEGTDDGAAPEFRPIGGEWPEAPDGQKGTKRSRLP